MNYLIVSTFLVRLVFACFLTLALVSYLDEFLVDQKTDYGVVTGSWHELTHGEDPRYPGHRNAKLYILLFLALLLVHLLLFVGIGFENTTLLCILLPPYLALIIVDFYYVGQNWLEVKFWFSLTAIVFGVLATLTGIAYVVLLYHRGPSTVAAVFEDSNADGEGAPSAGEPASAAPPGNFKGGAPNNKQLPSKKARKGRKRRTK